MATHATGTYFTLVETARRHDPDGNIAKIAEVLTEKNQLLEDAVFKEANNLTSHMYTRRLTEPSGSWVNVNEGVSIEASRTRQLVEPIKMLESYSRIDERILEVERNPEAFRSTEDISHVAGLSKTFAESFFYGDVADDTSEIIGLSNRDDWDAAADTNVEDEGGSGTDCSSVWIIDWGMDTVHMVYPVGSKTAGVEMEDLGRQIVNETSGALYTAMVTRFKMHTGIVVRDPACVQRIASVENSGTANNIDTDTLIKAIVKMPEQKGVIYMNKEVLGYLLIEAKDKTNVYYPPDDPWGRRWRVDFMGLPVKIVEQLSTTETAL